ncbi:MAG: ABC transporter permease [Ruminococcus sp.]|nr:ABC transporter permease [Ruminococcus sp.]
MNLMKLFNFNYFKENIKKSKGLLAFFFGVITLINIIVLIVIINATSKTGEALYINFATLSVTSFVGIYAIPLVFSMALLGFVFKQKSVDFIMSKPISRKSIYFTNVVGGIFIILAFMLFNTIIFALFSLMSSNIILPIPMLLDYFIYLSMIYIFMFSISILSISIAGNFMSSLVISLIILLLFPFSILVNKYYSNDKTFIDCNKMNCATNIVCSNKTCEENLKKGLYEIELDKDLAYKLTTPTSLFLDAEHTLNYSNYRLIKMLGLSIIYLLIGGYAFKVRKMENNETSFKSEFVHYLVKTITLLPVSFVAYLLVKESELIGIIISLVIILVYSALYDLITRKEIYRFLKSSLVSLITLVIFAGGYALYDLSSNNNYDMIDKVDKIVINLTYEDIAITDKNMIKSILKNKIEYDADLVYDRGGSYDASFYSAGNKYKGHINSVALKINNQDILQTLREKNIKDFNFDKIDYIYFNGTYIPKEKKLVELIKKADKKDCESEQCLNIHRYQNHKDTRVRIDLTSNKELADYVTSYMNEKTIKLLKANGTAVHFNNYYNLNYDSNIEDKISDSGAMFDYVVGSNLESFIIYLKENNQELTDNSLCIYAYINGYSREIIINDAIKFKEEYDKYKDRVKNSPTYQQLLEYNNNYDTEDMDGYDEY